MIPSNAKEKALSIFRAVARWRQNRRQASDQFDLPAYSPQIVNRIARYLGISASELHQIASYSSDRGDLLLRRMTALHLEPGEIACTERALFHELHILCVACESQGRCALDLADELADPGWQDWRDYCPNATRLSLLSALQCCSSGPEAVRNGPVKIG
jgi:hypothetical protein